MSFGEDGARAGRSPGGRFPPITWGYGERGPKGSKRLVSPRMHLRPHVFGRD